jgi:glutamate racemase
MQKLHSYISFFDSGQGGLTLWEDVIERFPRLSSIYLGDTARCPYGNRSAEIIVRYSQEAASFLMNFNTKILVIACGTASSVASKALSEQLDIPVIDIVNDFSKYVKNYIKNSSEPTSIAILGTQFTVKSQSLFHLLRDSHFQDIWQKDCPLFVPLVEEGLTQGEIPEKICELYLSQIPKNIEYILLACTHYPRLLNTIATTLNKLLKRPVFHQGTEKKVLLSNENSSSKKPLIILDPRPCIISRIKKILQNQNYESAFPTHKIYCTDSIIDFKNVAQKFTKRKFQHLEKIDLLEKLINKTAY